LKEKKTNEKGESKKNKSTSPMEIVVQKGETYYSLSKKYKIKIPELLKFNKLKEKDLLKEGDKIKIPPVN
jgi:LysM repeat protein